MINIENNTAEINKKLDWKLFLFSYLIALILNLFSYEYETFRPDFVSIILFYWALSFPLQLSLSFFFIIGLISDVAYSSILGQHALNYVLILFFVNLIFRRFFLLSFFGQIVYLLFILIIIRLILVLILMIFGNQFPGFIYFGSDLITCLLWPLVQKIFAFFKKSTR